MVNLNQNRMYQNVGLEQVKPKPINSHDMDRYGDMDIFLMQQAATGMSENTRPTRPRVVDVMERPSLEVACRSNMHDINCCEITSHNYLPANPPLEVYHPNWGVGVLNRNNHDPMSIGYIFIINGKVELVEVFAP